MRDIKEIVSILKENGVSGYRLEQDLDITQVGADKILNGKTKRPQRTTVDLLNAYIDNNFKPTKTSYTKQANAIWVNHSNYMLVPLVGHRAQAGFLSGWGDQDYEDELPKTPWEVDKQYKGKYVSFEVAGDSMDSSDPRTAILERDILLCREIQKQHWTSPLHIKKWNFVIVHKTEGILVKRIIKHDVSTGALTLQSLNPYYNDFEVQMDDLVAIFNVVDLHRKPLI